MLYARILFILYVVVFNLFIHCPAPVSLFSLSLSPQVITSLFFVSLSLFCFVILICFTYKISHISKNIKYLFFSFWPGSCECLNDREWIPRRLFFYVTTRWQAQPHKTWFTVVSVKWPKWGVLGYIRLLKGFCKVWVYILQITVCAQPFFGYFLLSQFFLVGYGYKLRVGKLRRTGQIQPVASFYK